ncbi:MAG: acyltransferase domain-containing protein [Anaerolineaceae bacterium]|nr:acyltransferase domain-containing protein [Anaerolineaceae bacterium]
MEAGINDSFESILKAMQMDSSLQSQVLDYIEAHSAELDCLSQGAYAGYGPAFPLCRRRPFTRLLVLIYRLMDIRRRYIAKGVPEKIFADTICDLTLRESLYYQKTGKHGLECSDVTWFRHLENVHIFKLGPLQFQRFFMIYLDETLLGRYYMRYIPEAKMNLPEKTPVINVHIQKGAYLSPALVDAAFDEARLFFQKVFPEQNFRAFHCYSWLLYPGLRHFLSLDSHIMHFARRFEIIGTVNDRDPAIKAIYGRRFHALKDYPQNTSLQKAAIRHFEYLGDACGIIKI